MDSSELNKNNIVDFILDLFARRGAEEYMGESVSMAQHMEQSAACAVADGAPDDLVVAALLHDIGHFVGDFPIDSLENGIDNQHEEAGARFLEHFYPPSVTEPIRLHVAAKKYLCAVDDQYFGAAFRGIDTIIAGSGRTDGPIRNRSVRNKSLPPGGSKSPAL